MAPRPAALMDELVEDVLLCLPPDNPALLLRAALVCKQWCRLVSSPGFRLRFSEFHRSPPMLGFLCNSDGAEHSYSRFIPASASCPPMGNGRREWRALDSRHGRVLLHAKPPVRDTEFAVWDPITGERWMVPTRPRYAYSWNAAVFCAGVAGGGACDHLSCHGGPFLVVFVGSNRKAVFACVYSSEAGAWREPTFLRPCHGHIDALPCALVGNALYSVFRIGARILKYSLDTQEMSVIPLPSGSLGRIVLMTMEMDNVLGFTKAHQPRLYLWSREADPIRYARWVQSKVIELEGLLHAAALMMPQQLLAFAHGVGALFVATVDGIFSIDMKSSQARKVYQSSYVRGVVPFIGFYTPVLGGPLEVSDQ